ncbi:uncharacterized protein TNCV_4525361 [Trichonephila clavipes]|nr:uncharacterized protein TNCV_4525361 [Trichonephila clavipes]
MSVKVHFLYSHLDYFPENFGAVSEEQVERFYQDIKEMEHRYQGRWNVNMMADYCWMLKRENSQEHSRKILLRTFYWGCGSPVIKVSDHGRHVMSSNPVPLKTCRVGQQCTLNLSRAEASSHWCGVGASSGVVHIT